MMFRDFVEVSMGNLRRKKMRSLLTTAGVVIAIATFVAMLSFAAGNHRYFTTMYEEFGFLNQVSVRSQRSSPSDSVKAPVLNSDALEKFEAIPGVRLAYPYASFNVSATVLDTTVATEARSLSTGAMQTRLFRKVLGDVEFSSESAHEAMVTNDFVELVGKNAGQLLGERIIISMKVARLDSAMAAVVDDPRSEITRLFRSLDQDSIYNGDYQRRFARRELSTRMSRFLDGFMNRQATVADTLTIVGVAPDDAEFQIRTSPIVVTERTARRLSSGGMVIDGNPADLLAAVQSGALFEPASAYDRLTYSRVTLELDPVANHKTVIDSVAALGYRGRSFAEQFDEMQRFMLYYYAGMAVIGLIALVTASLGIINTLIMSITERRREIGILKSLGADEGAIRRLFIVESCVIGIVGSAVGVTVGWIATRAVALIAKGIMAREDMPVFDPFALPLWLIGIAMLFGTVVSILAGLYPAARAARVDPVEALRSE